MALSTRHRKRGAEISRVDVGFHSVSPNLRVMKFHTLFVVGCTKITANPLFIRLLGVGSVGSVKPAA
jgi:hypothetical protein